MFILVWCWFVHTLIQFVILGKVKWAGPERYMSGKMAGTCFWLPTATSSAKVKEMLEFYFYYTPRSSWPVLGWTSHFTSTFISIYRAVSLAIEYVKLFTYRFWVKQLKHIIPVLFHVVNITLRDFHVTTLAVEKQ